MSEQFRDLPDTNHDPIMIANKAWPAFAAEHPDAINTTIGVLVNPATGKPWRPNTVIQAEALAHDSMVDSEAFGYQTPSGNIAFLDKARELTFGETDDSPDKEIFGYQTEGGTNALFLAREMLEALVTPKGDGTIPLVLDSGWPNHEAIFNLPFKISSYEHSDLVSGYNHEAAVEAFSKAPNGAVFLLQTCGYNDDGYDRYTSEWREILSIAEEKQAVIILDSAYLGLAEGFEEDRYPIQESVNRGLLTLVTFSASKNMGLYGERLGALFIANASERLGEEQAAKLQQLGGRCIRRTISSPQFSVAEAAAHALTLSNFYEELAQARDILRVNREIFAAVLSDHLPHIADGSGLFTKLLSGGFSSRQLDSLRANGIHALPNSRINLGGLQPEKVERVGNSVLQALAVN